VTVLVDTGVLVSVADNDEPRHSECAALLRRHCGQLAVAGPVVPET
jgi:predicted nucleic acid-binding protein